MNGNENSLHVEDGCRKSTRRTACVRRAALKDAGLLPRDGKERGFNSPPRHLKTVAAYTGRPCTRQIELDEDETEMHCATCKNDSYAISE